MDTGQLRCIDVAACGWSPVDWGGFYYPDDLPEDWQLSYYANEFRSVFLPAQQWVLNEAELLAWRDEVHEDFCFYLEMTREHLDAAHWSQLADALPKLNCAAVIRDESLLAELQGRVRRVDLLTDDVLLQPLWAAKPDELRLAVLRSEERLSPVQLRDYFEQFKNEVLTPELLIFLDAPYETVEKIQQMRELYGW